jgi:hypothetical protein
MATSKCCTPAGVCPTHTKLTQCCPCMQEWAGLQRASPAITQGLCNAVRRQAGESTAAQITLEAVIIAKVSCS